MSTKTHTRKPLPATNDVTEAERAAALERHYDELVARAGRMNAEQRAAIRRVFRYLPAE